MLEAIIGILERVLGDVFYPITRRILAFVTKTKNITQLVGRVSAKKFKEIVKRKPESIKDYVGIWKYYIDKRIVIVVTCVLILGTFLGIQKFMSYDKSIKEKIYISQNLPEKNDFTGAGIVRFEDKKVKYDGNLKNGQFEGSGKIYNKDGAMVYEGNFKEGLYSGYGKIFQSGENLLYKGDFENNVYSGKGTLYHPNGKMKYTGDFQNGKGNGKGTFYDESESKIYDGEVINDAYSGKGEEYTYGGSILYKGTFEEGKYSGIGTIFDKNGSKKYEGSFKKGTYFEKGITFYANGVKQYEGSFKDGIYSESGILYDEKGNKLYEGIFENGMSKSGKVYEESGKILYEGEFIENKFNGFGTLYSEEKPVFKGYFKDGEVFLNGFIELYYEDVKKLIGKPSAELVGLDKTVTLVYDVYKIKLVLENAKKIEEAPIKSIPEVSPQQVPQTSENGQVSNSLQPTLGSEQGAKKETGDFTSFKVISAIALEEVRHLQENN